jgi:molecular chaperone DnaK (HSP70)
LRFRVLEGTSDAADENELLGEFHVRGLRPSGDVTVMVSFSFDEEGIVHVAARDAATGAEQRLDVVNKNGLMQGELVALALETAIDDVERMLADAQIVLGDALEARPEIHDARAAIADAKVVAAEDIAAISRARDRLEPVRRALYACLTGK